MDIKKIKELLNKGDEKRQKKEYEAALKFFGDAVKLVPEPFEDNEIATDLLVAIGDTYFDMKSYKKALEVFTDVLCCSGAISRPYIRIRRGQIAFEIGELQKAKTEFVCAYLNGGREAFQNENRKYLDFIEPSIRSLR